MAVNVGLLHLPCLAAPKTLSYFEGAPPLGLAYVAAALRAAGYPPFVLDALGEAPDHYSAFPCAKGDLIVQGYDIDGIVDRLPANLDVLGIGNLFLHELRFLQRLLPAIKERFPDLVVIMGGENATGMWEDLLRLLPEVTGCILGEGDEAFPALIRVLERGAGLEQAPSLAYRVNGEPAQTPRAKRIRAVDDIPWPAWDLFPVARYLEARIRSGVYRGPSLPILTSRGCPYRCAFCSSPNMWGTTYVARTAAKLVDEIEWLMRTYGATNFDLRDLTSVLTKKWIHDFHAEVQRRQLTFTWQIPQGTRSENLSRETLELMYATGCRNFGYALESVAPHVIRRMKKKVVPERLFGSIREALQLGFRLDIFFVIGYPGETRWDHLAYLRAIVRLAWMGAHVVSLMQFNPYPGSADYFGYRKEGRIDFDDDAYIYSSLFRTTGQYPAGEAGFSTAYLNLFQTGCLLLFFTLGFLFRPWRVLSHAWALVRAREDTLLDQFLAVKVRQWQRVVRDWWGPVTRRIAPRRGVQ
jgi:radical SAM superfamily enzyme YgiQ (UPF0313 family)